MKRKGFWLQTAFFIVLPKARAETFHLEDLSIHFCPKRKGNWEGVKWSVCWGILGRMETQSSMNELTKLK